MKEAKNWKDSFFLDVNNNYKNKTDAMKKIEGDKISNLILVDPILKTRNAARAITNQKYNEFLFIVNNFSKFSDKDFIVKKILIKEKINIAKKFANKNNLNILIYNFDFSVENDSCDIIGSKLLKLFKKIEVYFEELDFPIFKSDFQISFDENKSVFIYFLENVQISNLKKVIGPKVYMELAVKKFLENKSDFFIQEDRVMIYKKRKITKLSQISNMKLKDLKIFFEKDLSFIKSFKKL